MSLITTYEDITIADLESLKATKRAEGWRCVQIFTTHNDDNGTNDLTYTFHKGDTQSNHRIVGITDADVIPSITDVFFSAFVYENEAHDLFGVKFEGIAIDFGGHFYDLAMNEPMTIMSPEKKAAKEKAARVAAAKAAKEAKEKAAKEGAPAPAPAAPAIDESKLAGMDPEKAAKVRAAMEAKAKREAEKAAKEAAEKAAAEMEQKLAGMDPEKAAKVRAAMEAKAKREAAKAAEGKGE